MVTWWPPWQRAVADLAKRVGSLQTQVTGLQVALTASQRQAEILSQEVSKIMTAQDDVAAAVAAVQAVVADVNNTVIPAIQQQIAVLTAAGTPVDTSALDAAIPALQQADAALDALANPPTPPVA